MFFHVGLLNIQDKKERIEVSDVDRQFNEDEKIIMDVDRRFSNLSSEKGYIEAFYHYIAEGGLALSGNGQPPSNKEGYRKLIEYYKTHEPPDFQLTWNPLFSFMADSGELGFNHGRYKSVSINKEGKKEEGFGYYISIWRKQTDGSWKFILDGGNQSPPMQIK